MKQFKTVNNVLGWLVFAIAAFVYCSTVEPTASFWDCPEFIVTGDKLEVGHPPGAPFFMLAANFFSHFASDASQVAYMVNIMNALLSAFCILFLFWTITHLARRLILKDFTQAPSLGQLIAIEGSGLVGALIYTFSDTFWYSAVEGEVYAFSSAFTAVVFWLILKWEEHADEPHSDRWLVLIAYLTGLSIGVHLLNLLCVPAIVLVFYYRRWPNSTAKGSLLALLVSFLVIFAVLYGVVPGIITVGGWFELLFVNVLGMPFNTGLIVYIILLVSVVIWAIYETLYDRGSLIRQNIAFMLSVALLGIPFYGYGIWAVIIGIVVLAVLQLVLFHRKKDKKMLVTARVKNTILLSLLAIMIGYSSYAVIVIRSSANPPMDQNSPEDIFTLGSYLSRDQYGYRPLLYGQAYTSEYKVLPNGGVDMTTGAPIYQRKEKASADEPDRYFIVSTNDKPKYKQNMFFPRMYSQQHAAAYERWFGGYQTPEGQWVGGIEGTLAPSNYQQGGFIKMPTFIENMKFFISYQCNFMYWRYFLWNFAGRQNDIQGHGEYEHGNWLSGIPFIDNARLGDQSQLPDDLKQNKGHNVFYCLPLLLGIIGLTWQAFRGRRGIRQFWIVFFLFFMTGLAIVLYLNQTPLQPRERDYAYAGSFYAFAIWCGLGVLAIVEMIRGRLLKEKADKTKAQKKDEKKADVDDFDRYIDDSSSKKSYTTTAAVVTLIALLVPIQMATQTWDDHDRSGRYTCRDFGRNYLMSMQDEGCPIIFTNGDNDTFPLWYNQEAEGERTDARVCNLSYIQTDWYIDQMKRPAYNSPALPISLPRIDYCEGTNNTIDIHPELKEQVLDEYHKQPEISRQKWGDEPFELKNIIKYWVRGDNPEWRVIPTDTLYIKIDKDAVRRSGIKKVSDSIPEYMIIDLTNMRYLTKGQLMTLEILAGSNWTRPVYMAQTVGEDNYLKSFGDYFIQEGLAYRFTPYPVGRDESKNFDTEKTYNAVMNRFRYGNLKQEGLYLDETVMRLCYTHRSLFAKLVLSLIAEGKEDKARKALAKMETELPTYNVPVDIFGSSLEIIHAYGALGNKKMMRKWAEALWNKSEQYLNWYLQLKPDAFQVSLTDAQRQLLIMGNINRIVGEYDMQWAQQLNKKLALMEQRYREKGGPAFVIQ